MAAMTWRDYHRMTMKQLEGRKVRSVRRLKNRIEELPAGAVFTIVDKRGGFGLKSDPCPHCGYSMWITRISPLDVELLPEGENG